MALTGQDLCAKLGIEAKQLAAWVRKGLPHSGRGAKRTFDPFAVRDWLVAQGLAAVEPPAEIPVNQPIAHTWAQVAEYFNVSARTVHTWIKQGMPGRSGRPGTQEGQFPLHDIEAWREGRKDPRISTGDETKNQAQARLSTLRADMLERELREKDGVLIDANEVARHWLRCQNECRAQLTQLPALIAKHLPEKLSPSLRKKMRKKVQEVVDACMANLSTFMRDEADTVEAGETEPGDGSQE
jgi:phage terminase Nu1 subunit (DNA packaging protein)